MSRAPRRPPLPVVAVAAVTVAFFVLPLVGLIDRASWSTLGHDLTSADARSALRLSLVCSLSATALSIAFGMPLAWVLARVTFPGRALVRGLVLLPLVLPPVVGGVALLAAFSRRGLVGSHLYDWFGIQLTFTTAGAILAETFVALPFFVITVEAGLRSMDRRYEDVAATLGAGRLTVFRRVTLPLIVPAFFAGLGIVFIRSMTAISATIFLVSIGWTLITVRILENMTELSLGPAAAFSVLVVAIVFVVIGAIGWLLRFFRAPSSMPMANMLGG